MNQMNESDYLQILDSFDGDMVLFFLFMKVSSPTITRDIPRACVILRFDGTIEMKINPDFWKKLTYYEKKFVIAHELLHIYYSHMHRMKMMGDRQSANIAADIITNETLVNVFGFEREMIRFHNNLCWKDTIFGSKEKDLPLKTFEHYYKRLLDGEGDNKSTLDNHQGDEGYPQEYSNDEKSNNQLSDAISKELSKLDKETLDQLKEEISAMDDEMEGDGNSLESKDEKPPRAGTGIGSMIKSYEYRVSYYAYFKNVIDRWLDKFEFEQYDDQFMHTEPYLELVSEKMLVPSEAEVDDMKFERNKLWVYVDASGSCVNDLPDFIRVCGGIPTEHFDISFFSFTTEVRPIKRDKKNNLKLSGISGGTTFSCIDHHINKETKKKDVKKPDYVFILTDGMAPKIKIKSMPPDRWHFFVIPTFKKKVFDIFIPDGAIIHDFTDIK